MKHTGIFITAEELESVRIEQECSGMFLSGGTPMGDPSRAVDSLIKKYRIRLQVALDLKTGEFMEHHRAG